MLYDHTLFFTMCLSLYIHRLIVSETLGDFPSLHVHAILSKTFAFQLARVAGLLLGNCSELIGLLRVRLVLLLVSLILKDPVRVDEN
jgi:hypothetical protein